MRKSIIVANLKIEIEHQYMYLSGFMLGDIQFENEFYRQESSPQLRVEQTYLHPQLACTVVTSLSYFSFLSTLTTNNQFETS